MRATDISKTIATAHRIQRPLLVWGAPGVGKSSLYHQYAKEMELPLLDWRLTMMDPVDMRGTPKQEKNTTVWVPPAELPREGKGIILLDELPQARADTKNVAAMLVLERRIGEYRVPPGWWICAAGNRMSDAAGTSPMPTHLNNRFWHVNFELSVEDWLAWAEEADIDYRVYAYIKYRPAALLDFDPRSKDPAFATPRSNELLSDIVKDLDATGTMMDMEPAVLAESFAGAVGAGRGNEFAGFLRAMDSLVQIETVFASPDSAPLPDDPSVCYALMTALAVAAKRDTLGAAAIYVTRLPREFAMLFMHAVEKRNVSLVKSKAYIDMCKQYQAQL